jgi:hypothetical protein
MKLYWRVKRNGKWTWKAVAPGRVQMELVISAMDKLNSGEE